MAASFLVALTVVPALCSIMLGKTGKARSEPIISRTIKRIISKIAIESSIKFPHAALALAVAVSAFAFAFFPIMGRDFIPALNEGSSLLILQLSPESSIERSKEIGAIVQKILSKNPEVKRSGMKIGRAEKDDHAEPVNIVKFNVEFDTSKRPQSEIIKDLRKQLRPRRRNNVFNRAADGAQNRLHAQRNPVADSGENIRRRSFSAQTQGFGARR